MIKRYLIERVSWIFLFLLQQIIFLLIAYLDPSIPLSAVGYIVFVSLIVFVIFLIYRYQKETDFFHQLEERENDFDLSNMSSASSPFEKIVENSIIEQTKHLKQTASENRLLIEQEKDDLLAWIPYDTAHGRYSS